MFKRLLWGAFVWICAIHPLFSRSPEAAATVVLFNREAPDSESLARYYAKRRDIPAEQVIGLSCPLTEEIHRADFENTIAKPLQKSFQEHGWWAFGEESGDQRPVKNTKIRFVAIMRGIPLKIKHDPTIAPATFVPDLPNIIASRNDASVDSEIAALGISTPEPGGIVPNPYFRRFTPILDNPVLPGMLLPSRLDAPSSSLVRTMIDNAISAERDGLWGWAYVDGRGITSGGLAEGDQWMSNLVNSMRSRGIPVIFDNIPPTFFPSYPMTDAAVYYGWYAADVTGPFAEETFQFRPGAIAVHLHSFSAATLHSIKSKWCGPLLARGATATLGNVYEPFLVLTANLDIFQDRLMAGFTLAESAYISQKALSWMGIVVGDPLYRPYASWQVMEKQPSAESKNMWQTYRDIVLQADGNVLNAAEPLRKIGKNLKQSMFLEALGAAQFDAKKFAEALASFDTAISLKPDKEILHRLTFEKIVTLRALNRTRDAETLANSLGDQCPPGARKDFFLQFVPKPTPSASPLKPTESASPSPPQ